MQCHIPAWLNHLQPLVNRLVMLSPICQRAGLTSNRTNVLLTPVPQCSMCCVYSIGLDPDVYFQPVAIYSLLLTIIKFHLKSQYVWNRLVKHSPSSSRHIASCLDLPSSYFPCRVAAWYGRCSPSCGAERWNSDASLSALVVLNRQ
jgi:hypothetical protein